MSSQVRESTTLNTATATLNTATATLNMATPVNLVEPTLQMTAQVILESTDGKQFLARALLDPGASISLVGRKVVQQLQLKKHPHKLCITGAQGVTIVHGRIEVWGQVYVKT